MADQKISTLTDITGANQLTDDELAIVDTSAASTKKTTKGELFKNVPGISFNGGGDLIKEYDRASYATDFSDASGNSLSSGDSVRYVVIGHMVFVSFVFLNNMSTTGLVATDEFRCSIPRVSAASSISSVLITGLVSGVAPFFVRVASGTSHLVFLDSNYDVLLVNQINDGVTDFRGGTVSYRWIG